MAPEEQLGLGPRLQSQRLKLVKPCPFRRGELLRQIFEHLSAPEGDGSS